MLAPLTKTCTKCSIEKPTFEFGAKKTGKNGKSPHCRSCIATANAEYRANNPEKIKAKFAAWYAKNPDKKWQYHRKKYERPDGRAMHLLNGAKQRRPDGFTLTLEHVTSGISHGHCAATGIPFNLTVNRKQGMTRHPYAPSLDKIDPQKPYTDENTRVVIWQYNMMKGELSDADVLVLARIIVERAGG